MKGTTTTEYWVRPDVESECPLYTPQHQCVTITDLVISSTNSSLNQGSNVTVHFLPGVHTPRVEGRVFISDESENATKVSIAATLEGVVNKSVIHCLQKKITFVFANTFMFKIKSLIIENCGYESEMLNMLNYMSAVTVIFTKRAVLVYMLIDQVTLSNSLGFGLRITQNQRDSEFYSDLELILIIVNSTIQYSNCCYSKHKETFGGSISISTRFASLYTTISYSTVSHGCSQCIEQVQISQINYLSGGLDIFGIDSLIKVEIKNSLFEKNKANIGGGICVTSIRSFTTMKIVTSKFIQNKALGCGGGIRYFSPNDPKSDFFLLISDSAFLGNEAITHGGGICIKSFEQTKRIEIQSSLFKQNTASAIGGAININSDNNETVHFIYNCTFLKNSAKEAGAAIAIHGNTTIIISRFTQHEASDKGCVFLLTSILILDNSQITDNDCGALYISKSTVIIEGSVVIANNYARESSGGGVYLECNEWWATPTHVQFSKLILGATGQLVIVNNKADKFGGGIYIDYECSKSDQCLFDTKFNPLFFKNDISLNNNSAIEAGNTIFGGNFDKKVCSGWYLSDIEKVGFTSFPKYACICSIGVNKCETEPMKSTSLFRGQELKVPVMCIGQLDLPSPCTIRAKSRTSGAAIADKSKLQDVGLQCKDFFFIIKISRYDVTKILVELASKPTHYDNKYDSIKVQITLNNCPLGFTTKLNSGFLSCDCTDLLLENEEIRCDINRLLLFKPGWMWIGNYSGEITAHQNCPHDYCKSEFTDVHPNNQQEQCAFNRSGVLCGACQPGLSLVLGTSLCKECSNLNLLLLIPFALSGVVLVLFLLKCNLTVSTGTFNGLIFYANIIQANKNLFFPPERNNDFVYILSVFIAWLNLDLGIETCFVGGLNMYYRTWLQFVFPVYIWSLAGLIILTSRYSIMISNWSSSNIVQVLATLFLLSYAKLLRVTIDIFSSTPLRNTNGTTLVWLLDGNYMFLNGPHAVLFMAALVTLLVHIIPFTVLLLFSTALQQYSHHKPFKWVNKLKPLLDAYHGPYKDNSRHWTGLLLLVRLILLSAVAANVNSNRATTLLIICTAILLILIYISLKDDKLYMQKFPHYLEIFFMANLSLFSLSSLYLASDKARLRFQGILVCCTIGSALVGAFILIIGYHSFLLYISTQNGKALYQKISTVLSRKQRSNAEEDLVQTNDMNISTSFQSTSCIELKEPLLDDS